MILRLRSLIIFRERKSGRYILSSLSSLALHTEREIFDSICPPDSPHTVHRIALQRHASPRILHCTKYSPRSRQNRRMLPGYRRKWIYTYRYARIHSTSTHGYTEKRIN